MLKMIEHLNLDVILIQEPYIKYENGHIIENIPRDYEVFHNLTDDHAYGSIIVANNRLKPTKITTTTENHIVGLSIETNNGVVNLFSIYCRPSVPLMQSLAPLQQPGLQFDNSILAMDANA